MIAVGMPHYLDDPFLQEEVVHYARQYGKIEGVHKVIKCKDDQTIRNYLKTEPVLEARVNLAKRGFANQSPKDLQETWNENATLYNSLTVQTFLDYLVRGEVFTKHTIIRKPVKDSKTREFVRDDEGEQVFEVEKDIVETTTRSCPKDILKMATELMDGRYGVPELQKHAPTILVMFINHIAQTVNLPKEMYEQLLGEASSFDQVIEKQAMLMQKKK